MIYKEPLPENLIQLYLRKNCQNFTLCFKTEQMYHERWKRLETPWKQNISAAITLLRCLKDKNNWWTSRINLLLRAQYHQVSSLPNTNMSTKDGSRWKRMEVELHQLKHTAHYRLELHPIWTNLRHKIISNITLTKLRGWIQVHHRILAKWLYLFSQSLPWKRMSREHFILMLKVSWCLVLSMLVDQLFNLQLQND